MKEKKNKEAYALSPDELLTLFEDGKEKTALAKRKQGFFTRFLLIWCAAILLVGALGCLALYRYLDAYETALPEHVMDALLQNTSAEEWQERVRVGLDRELSEFDDREAIYAGYAEALLGEGEYTYRRDTRLSEKKAPVYTVSLEGLDLCRVTLTPDSDAALGFGLHRWQVGEVEPCPALGNLSGVAVEIDAPSGQSVYLNGRPLGVQYITDDAVPCPNAPAIEARFPEGARYVRYRVDALYGEIRVTDGHGDEYAPTLTEAGLVRYSLPAETTYSVTVRAPSDVTVTLCGAELAASDAKSIDAGILEGLEAYTGAAAYETVTYAFSGLYTEPAVTARDTDGNELVPLLGENGSIAFFHVQDEELCAAQRDTVRAFFRAYVDYSADAFLGDLSVTKEMLDDPEQAENIPEHVASSMRRYYKLLDSILWGSELYEYVIHSTDAMVWASHTRVNYNELTFTDFSYVGEDCFVCTVRYKADFAASAWYESYTYDMQNAYEIAFVRAPWGSWYAAAMTEIGG